MLNIRSKFQKNVMPDGNARTARGALNVLTTSRIK